MADTRARAQGSPEFDQFPDTASRRLIVETAHGRREVRLGRGRCLCGAAAGALLLGWTLTATAGFVISALSGPGGGSLLEDAYAARIAALESRLAEAEAAGTADAARLDTALAQVVSRDAELRAARERLAERGAELAEIRAKLAGAVEARDAARTRTAQVETELAALRRDFGDDAAQVAELDRMLASMAGALDDAAAARDSSADRAAALDRELQTLRLKMEIAAERQTRLLASLEQAVEMSFRPLEEMFETAGLDVDSLLADVRRSYSGIGGLPERVLPASLPAPGDADLQDRYGAVMQGMDRLNLLRIATEQVPLAMPVVASHRFTSGFGMRRHPVTGTHDRHEGIDLAAPRGTPILATAEGTVTRAGWMSGYGKMVEIRHGFGFRTRYAHLNKIHVSKGERVARAAHIGDMGTTGRSTGVHLHYEVHANGQPVNPLTYIKAARDVF